MRITRAMFLILFSVVLTSIFSFSTYANVVGAVPTATPSKRAQYLPITSSNVDKLTLIRKMHDPYGSPHKFVFAPDNSSLSTISWNPRKDPSESSWYGGSWNLTTGRETVIKLVQRGNGLYQISSDGRYIAARSEGGSDLFPEPSSPLNVFDLVAGKRIFSSEGQFMAWPAALHKDGNSVALYAVDNDSNWALYSFQFDTQELRKLLNLADLGTYDPGDSVVWRALVDISPDFQFTMTLRKMDYRLNLWDVKQGKMRPDLFTAPHDSWVFYSPDGKYAFTGGPSARLIDLATGHQVAELVDGTPKFSNNSKFIAVTYTDSPYLFDIETNQVQAQLPEGLQAYIFTPDSQKLILVDQNVPTAHVWDVAQGTDVCTFPENSLSFEQAYSRYYPRWGVSPDSSMLIDHTGGNVVMWDLNTCKLLTTFHGTSSVVAYAFSADGSLLATSDISGTIAIWGIKAQ